MKITRRQLKRLIQEEFQLLNEESLEGKEPDEDGNDWDYEITDAKGLSGVLTPADVKQVMMKVVSGSNVGHKFALGDIEKREGKEAYNSHPLVMQVIAALASSDNEPSTWTKWSNFAIGIQDLI